MIIFVELEFQVYFNKTISWEDEYVLLRIAG